MLWQGDTKLARAANRDHDGKPITVARNESRPVIQIKLGVDAERSRRRMRAGHLSQSHSDGEGDRSTDYIAEHHRRPGDFDGGSRAEQQTGADRASDSKHCHLAGGKLSTEPRLIAGQSGCGRGLLEGAQVD